MPVTPLVEIPAPDVEPYKYGLLGATQAPQGVDEHWISGGVEFKPLTSYIAHEYPTAYGQTGVTKAVETGLPLVDAVPFTVYGGVMCGSVGQLPEEWTANAEALLDIGAPYGVEHAFWTGDAGNTPYLAAAATPKLKGNTAVSLVKGLGLLERALNATGHNSRPAYGGQGLVHAPRNVATYARSKRLTVKDDAADALLTPAGNRWVFGAGYDGTGPAALAPADDDHVWLYVTGAAFILRADTMVPVDFPLGINRTNNQVFIVAERPYLVGIDGPIFAVLVDLTL